MLDRAGEQQTANHNDSVGRVAIVGALTVVSTLIGSQLVLNQQVRSYDERLFARLVPWLQDAEWLVDISGVLTDVGSKNVAYGAALLLMGALVVIERSLRHALVVLVTLVTIHGLQWLTFALAKGVVPTEHVIGTAGPYYSGGVVRALVVSGVIVFAVTGGRRAGSRWLLWGVPLAVGLLEAGTRMVLGRHWPLDVAVALPIGAALLWCHQHAWVWIEEGRTRR